MSQITPAEVKFPSDLIDKHPEVRGWSANLGSTSEEFVPEFGPSLTWKRTESTPGYFQVSYHYKSWSEIEILEAWRRQNRSKTFLGRHPGSLLPAVMKIIGEVTVAPWNQEGLDWRVSYTVEVPV